MKTLLLAMGDDYQPSGVPSWPCQTTSVVEAGGREATAEEVARVLIDPIVRCLGCCAYEEEGLSESERRRAWELAYTKYRSDEWNQCR